MWFKNIFSRSAAAAEPPLFDEAFLRRLERMSLQAQQTLRGQPAGGEHLSRNQLPATIFSDHRPYSSGDDYRYIDWNAYAHQDEIYVRLGEVEQSVAVHLLLDASRSMAYGAPSKLRLAQQLTAALGYLALAQHDRLQIAPFGDAPQRPFGPARGKGRLHEMLRFVESARADQPTALAQTLAAYSRRHPLGGLLVICSDLLAPDNLERGLQHLPPPRWQVLVQHLLDRRELQPDLSGPLELEDAETGVRLALTLDAPTLAAYRQNITAWQEQLAQICARRGASYAQTLSDWPLERQVLPYLRARRVLR